MADPHARPRCAGRKANGKRCNRTGPRFWPSGIPWFCWTHTKGET